MTPARGGNHPLSRTSAASVAFGAFIGAVTRASARRVILCAAAAYLGAYLLPNRTRAAHARLLPMTRVDRAVPFLPSSIWIYLSAYLLVFPAFLVGDRDRGARFVAALASTVATATVVHWIYPTAYPREQFPLPQGTGAWTRRALESLRRVDTPASCLPSLHVAAALVSALSLRGAGRATFLVALTWASLVGVSTLTTKQHYVADVLAGGALACVAARLFSCVPKSK